jgi:glycosyltransferase involved in cell wall biosynthesis
MKNPKTPTVSIIMATYNRANQLTNTINNIFEQSYKEIELIVINDGSSDDTSEILQQLQSKFKFAIIENPQNLGLQKSLNIGISHASGKFIARIDDHDNWIDREKLSKQVSFLEANPSIGLVGTGYRVGTQNMINPLTDSAIRNQILMRSPFCHVSVLITRNVLDKVDGYDENLTYSEDWDLWLKIGRHAQLANLPDITVAIQEEGISLSKDFYLKQMPINRQIVKHYYNDYPKKFKAYFYHQFIRFFFAIFPINGSVHKMMKIGFLKYFALITNKNTFNEPTA